MREFSFEVISFVGALGQSHASGARRQILFVGALSLNMCCNTPEHTATHCNTLVPRESLNYSGLALRGRDAHFKTPYTYVYIIYIYVYIYTYIYIYVYIYVVDT